jgi:hypothetical protein
VYTQWGEHRLVERPAGWDVANLERDVIDHLPRIARADPFTRFDLCSDSDSVALMDAGVVFASSFWPAATHPAREGAEWPRSNRR